MLCIRDAYVQADTFTHIKPQTLNVVHYMESRTATLGRETDSSHSELSMAGMAVKTLML